MLGKGSKVVHCVIWVFIGVNAKLNDICYNLSKCYRYFFDKPAQFCRSQVFSLYNQTVLFIHLYTGQKFYLATCF